MIVADSSFIVEALLSGGDEFLGETFVAPDFAVNEVANAFFVQQHSLHAIDDGRPYVEKLFEAIDAESLSIVTSSQGLVRDAYDIASRRGGSPYDCLFIALALKGNLELRTRDRRQAALYQAEKSMQGQEERRPEV